MIIIIKGFIMPDLQALMRGLTLIGLLTFLPDITTTVQQFANFSRLYTGKVPCMPR